MTLYKRKTLKMAFVKRDETTALPQEGDKCHGGSGGKLQMQTEGNQNRILTGLGGTRILLKKLPSNKGKGVGNETGRRQS